MKQEEQEIKEFLDKEFGDGEETSKPTHSEAPASVNIKVWIEGYGVMFTFRANDKYKVIDEVSDLVLVAKKKGWKTSWNTDEPVTSTTAPTYHQPARSANPPTPQPQGSTPVCRIHGRPMREFNGRYGPFFKCTAKLADGSYCSEKSTVM